MAQRSPPDDRNDEQEPKFYHPAGSIPPFYVRQMQRLWARLFSHRF